MTARTAPALRQIAVLPDPRGWPLVGNMFQVSTARGYGDCRLRRRRERRRRQGIGRPARR